MERKLHGTINGHTRKSVQTSRPGIGGRIIHFFDMIVSVIRCTTLGGGFFGTRSSIRRITRTTTSIIVVFKRWETFIDPGIGKAGTVRPSLRRFGLGR